GGTGGTITAGTAGQGGSGNGGSGNGGSGNRGSGNGGSGGTAATGGSGGSGGTFTQTALGATCASDADCGSDFTCLPVEDGIANGMCTKNCMADSECGDSGHCSSDGTQEGICYEACTFGDDPDGQELNPNKCHGRPDLGCFPDSDANGDLDFTRSNCLPFCRNDEECGAGYCNPSNGLC